MVFSLEKYFDDDPSMLYFCIVNGRRTERAPALFQLPTIESEASVPQLRELGRSDAPLNNLTKLWDQGTVAEKICWHGKRILI